MPEKSHNGAAPRVLLRKVVRLVGKHTGGPILAPFYGPRYAPKTHDARSTPLLFYFQAHKFSPPTAFSPHVHAPLPATHTHPFALQPTSHPNASSQHTHHAMTCFAPRNLVVVKAHSRAEVGPHVTPPPSRCLSCVVRTPKCRRHFHSH